MLFILEGRIVCSLGGVYRTGAYTVENEDQYYNDKTQSMDKTRQGAQDELAYEEKVSSGTNIYSFNIGT